MAKKRKADQSGLQEDSATYGSFCRAANSIAHLYQQGLIHEKRAFKAGRKRALEDVMSWVTREHGADEISTAVLVAHLRREISSLAPSAGGPIPHHDAERATARRSAGQLDSRVIAHDTGRLLRGERGAFFAGALSSPARRMLPHVARLAPARSSPVVGGERVGTARDLHGCAQQQQQLLANKENASGREGGEQKEQATKSEATSEDEGPDGDQIQEEELNCLDFGTGPYTG